MENKYLDIVKEAVEAIDFKGDIIEVKPFGGGHINDTFLVVTENEHMREKYILQRINHDIFKNVEKLMENYCNVCDYLKKVVKGRGGNHLRETITVVKTKNGNSFVKDSKGNYWRGILFIENSITTEVIQCKEDFYKTGKAFGGFQNMLSAYKADTLYESIPNFHNTKERFKTFLEDVENDIAGRKSEVEDDINFILAREKDTAVLVDLLAAGELPLRVTHNDTKIGNILLDKDTKEGICIIDLDTIMPGLSLYDFGDAIRSGSTYAAEDEKDLEKVYVDLELFEAFTKGFIEGAAGVLRKKEIEMLPMGAKVIILEQAIRFLGDYLNGDVYYKTSYDKQNLYRTRTQLKLVADMEEKWSELNEIVKAYS